MEEFYQIPYGVLSITYVLSHHEPTIPMISKALSSRLHVSKCISPYRRVFAILYYYLYKSKTNGPGKKLFGAGKSLKSPWFLCLVSCTNPGWRDHHVNRPQMYAHSYAPFTRSKNDLDRIPDHDQEGVLVYTGHSLFKTTKRITTLFICYISIHLISGLKLSRLRSRSSLHWANLLDPDIDENLDNYALCRRVIRVNFQEYEGDRFLVNLVTHIYQLKYNYQSISLHDNVLL